MNAAYRYDIGMHDHYLFRQVELTLKSELLDSFGNRVKGFQSPDLLSNCNEFANILYCQQATGTFLPFHMELCIFC